MIRNWSSWARDFHAADAYLVSIPKCGRTWIRVFLGSYFEAAQPTDQPRIKHTHDLWDHRCKSTWYEKLRGKRLIPSPDRHQKPVVLMVRDPRDLLVSLHFHLTRRSNEFNGNLSELVRSDLYGIHAVVSVWNHWIEEWTGNPRFFLLRYEQARTNPHEVFSGLVNFLSPGPVQDDALELALEASSFENMKRMEQTGAAEHGGVAGVDASALRPGRTDDPASFKVRAGRVGGYLDHLSELDLEYIRLALRDVHPSLGYD